MGSPARGSRGDSPGARWRRLAWALGEVLCGERRRGQAPVGLESALGSDGGGTSVSCCGARSSRWWVDGDSGPGGALAADLRWWRCAVDLGGRRSGVATGNPAAVHGAGPSLHRGWGAAVVAGHGGELVVMTNATFVWRAGSCALVGSSLLGCSFWWMGLLGESLALMCSESTVAAALFGVGSLLGGVVINFAPSKSGCLAFRVKTQAPVCPERAMAVVTSLPPWRSWRPRSLTRTSFKMLCGFSWSLWMVDAGAAASGLVIVYVGAAAPETVASAALWCGVAVCHGEGVDLVLLGQ